MKENGESLVHSEANCSLLKFQQQVIKSWSPLMSYSLQFFIQPAFNSCLFFISLEALWKSQVKSSTIQPACSCIFQSEAARPGDTDLLKGIELVGDGLLDRWEYIKALRETSESTRLKWKSQMIIVRKLLGEWQEKRRFLILPSI